MFMPDKNFGITEFAVTRAIKELNEQHEYISASMIAEHIGCSDTAVYRALRRLKKSNMVKVIEGNSRWGGSKYEYVGTR